MPTPALEAAAAVPVPLDPNAINAGSRLPYGLTAVEVFNAMNDFQRFLGFINGQLVKEGMDRLEVMMMPANFSSLVGEFVGANLPKRTPALVKNQYHNGYPDLIPPHTYADNKIQYGDKGIEVKASRYTSGWQGHNEEEGWLMVFVFDSNRPVDADNGVVLKPFRFLAVFTERLEKTDWNFSGRTGESRRTITASVRPTAAARMRANFVYSVL